MSGMLCIFIWKSKRKGEAMIRTVKCFECRDDINLLFIILCTNCFGIYCRECFSLHEPYCRNEHKEEKEK